MINFIKGLSLQCLIHIVHVYLPHPNSFHKLSVKPIHELLSRIIFSKLYDIYIYSMD
jgi:hypothetical protein